jgi:hypothetical protein
VELLNENKCEGNNKFSLFGVGIPYHRIAIVILCLGISLRFLGLNKGLWTDEYYYVQLLFHGDFIQRLRWDTHPPLYFFLLKLWSQISVREGFLRSLSVIFGIGTLVFTMKWTRRYSLSAGLLAGLLCATIPVMLRYSQEIRAYPMLLFATVLSFFFASRLSGAPEKTVEYIGLSLSLSLATASHLVGVMLIPAVVMFGALTITDFKKISYSRSVLAVAAPCIIFLYEYLFFLHRLPQQENWWMPGISLSLVLSTFADILGISYLLVPAKIMQNHLPALAIIYESFVKLIAVGICISLLFFGNWRRSLPLLIAAIFYLLELIIYSLFFTPIFWYRVALPALIPFIGFMALQLDSIRIRRVKVASITGVVILCTLFAAGWAAHSAWVPYEQWKQISRSLQAKWKPGDLVLFYPESAEGPIRYYFPDLPYEKGLAVKKGTDITEVEIEIRKRVGLSAEKGLFLIVRSSLGIRKDLQTYHNLLAYLRSECGQPALSLTFGNLSLSKYECHLLK